MQKFRPQYKRLLFIDRKIRERVYPNFVTLAKEWEVSKKTIQRDIDYLRSELNAPLAYDPVKHGFYYTERNFSLPAISMSESDLFSVCVAETVLSQYRNTPLFKKLTSVFEKIREALPANTEVNPAWMDERILVFPEPATQVNANTWETVAKAIRENRRLWIRHASPRASEGETEREVDPYYLVSYKGEWYLSSHCHLRNTMRTFAVSRISKARILEPEFRLPAGMTKDKMFGDQFGIIWKEQFHDVRIRFTATIAPFIRERQWHPRQKIREQRGGGLILEFTTNHLNEVKDWVLSWGPEATVLAPAGLARKVNEAALGILGNYPTADRNGSAPIASHTADVSARNPGLSTVEAGATNT